MHILIITLILHGHVAFQQGPSHLHVRRHQEGIPLRTKQCHYFVREFNGCYLPEQCIITRREIRLELEKNYSSCQKSL